MLNLTSPIKSEEAGTLSEQFSAEVRASLSVDELAEVNRRNAEQEDSPACSTHEFYDSNMSMWDAFLSVFGREMDCATALDAAICNSAWNTSKAAGFAEGAA